MRIQFALTSVQRAQGLGVPPAVHRLLRSMLLLGLLALTAMPDAFAAGVPKLALNIVNGRASLTITGQVGSVCSIQCLTNLSQPDGWRVLDTVALTNTIQTWTDTNALAGSRWFYRGLVQPVTCLRYSYGTSQMGQSLVYYKITPTSTNGKKALLNYEVHGFEDAWYRDGYGLTAIANLVKAYYLTNPAALNGWTVYLNPSANPDGEIYGNNNQRESPPSTTPFGRCTYNGRDINRHFSQNVCVEQLKLATLVTNLAPTIILDFHGWCNCYYAEGNGVNVGKYFQDAFNASYDGKPSMYGYVNANGSIDWGSTLGGAFHGNSTMTADMFAEWANSAKNIPAAIIEYPAPAYSNPGGQTYDTVYDSALGLNVIKPSVRDSMAERTEVALNNLFLTY
jgi:hypothetical protein